MVVPGRHALPVLTVWIALGCGGRGPGLVVSEVQPEGAIGTWIELTQAAQRSVDLTGVQLDVGDTAILLDGVTLGAGESWMLGTEPGPLIDQVEAFVVEEDTAIGLWDGILPLQEVAVERWGTVDTSIARDLNRETEAAGAWCGSLSVWEQGFGSPGEQNFRPCTCALEVDAERDVGAVSFVANITRNTVQTSDGARGSVRLRSYAGGQTLELDLGTVLMTGSRSTGERTFVGTVLEDGTEIGTWSGACLDED